MLFKNPDCLKLNERTFTKPIEPLTENIEQTVYFPSDCEASTNGIVALAWRGPYISDMRQLIAIDILFAYLTDSTISPLQSHFINNKSYCSKVTYQIEEYRESQIMISFINTQLEHLNKIKDDFNSILNDIIDKNIDFDMKRVVNIIKMKIAEINDKFEDEPHQTSSRVCIGDFLYGSLENQSEFMTRFNQAKIFEDLKSEDTQFWLELADKYLRKTYSVTIHAKPCEKLVKSLGDEDKLRIEERKKKLGKKGLKDLKRAVENAIDENDGAEVPDSVYDSIKVPSLENVDMRMVKQFYTHCEPKCNEFECLDHLQMQIDHLDGTNFVQITLLVDTMGLKPEQKIYLELFTNLLFELPVESSNLTLSHEEVVYQLNRDLLEYGTSLGINGGQLEPGIYAEYMTMFAKVPIDAYEGAVTWLKNILFNSVFNQKQILIALSNLLKEITKRKTQPSDLIYSLSADINFKSTSNICANNFLRQEEILKAIQDKLLKTEDVSFIKTELDNLRSSLLKDKQIRFYICADIKTLNKKNKRSIDAVWKENFPADLKFNELPIFETNCAFCVPPVWKLKKTYENDVKSLTNDCKIFSQLPKKDFVVNLGTSDSAYLRLVSSLDINSYYHENYPGLLVLIEYFCQTEGPLWEAVRGPGYAYHQSMHLSPEVASLELNLDECSNVTKAYEATRKTFMDHLNKKNGFDPNLLETAKNSLIFMLIDDLKSVSSISAYSMSCLFKGVTLNAVP